MQKLQRFRAANKKRRGEGFSGWEIYLVFWDE